MLIKRKKRYANNCTYNFVKIKIKKECNKKLLHVRCMYIWLDSEATKVTRSGLQKVVRKIKNVSP